MATATYNSNFDSNNLAKKTYFPPGGVGVAFGSVTVPTTGEDTTGDFSAVDGLPCGRHVFALLVTCDDLDTSTGLDADVVAITWDSAGNQTVTILWNAGTAFQSAIAQKWIEVDDVLIPQSRDGFAALALYVNTAATTPAQGVFTCRAFYR